MDSFQLSQGNLRQEIDDLKVKNDDLTTRMCSLQERTVTLLTERDIIARERALLIQLLWERIQTGDLTDRERRHLDILSAETSSVDLSPIVVGKMTFVLLVGLYCYDLLLLHVTYTFKTLLCHIKFLLYFRCSGPIA